MAAAAVQRKLNDGVIWKEERALASQKWEVCLFSTHDRLDIGFARGNQPADDTYLIVPANLPSSISAELQHIESWSSSNNLKLNKTKSFKLIFHLPRSRFNKLSIPPAPESITRVDELTCLGVTLCSDFSVSKHIGNTISLCSQSLYALRTHFFVRLPELASTTQL